MGSDFGSLWIGIAVSQSPSDRFSTRDGTDGSVQEWLSLSDLRKSEPFAIRNFCAVIDNGLCVSEKQRSNSSGTA